MNRAKFGIGGAVVALALAAGCTTGASTQLEPDAASLPYEVPASAPCETYVLAEEAGDITSVPVGYRILVLSPFVPNDIGSDPVNDPTGQLVVVWHPQLAGGRLGAVGRLEASDPTCVWRDALK